MFKSKVNQQNFEFELKGLKAYVNSVTGRLSVNFFDIENGMGNFNIGVNHVYNSHFEANELNGNCDCVKGKWNLSCNMRIFKYNSNMNLDSFTSNDYVLVDSNLYIHKFVLFKEKEDTNEKYYYASSNSSILKVCANYIDLIDQNDNIIRFVNGRVESTISGINNDIQKAFVYDNLNRLVRIYDPRKFNLNTHLSDGSSRFIDFYYNEDGLLSSVYNGIDRINYEYNGDMLVNVYQSRENYKKNLYHFSYDSNNRLECIYEYSENKGYYFAYYDNSNLVEGLDSRFYNDLVERVLLYKGNKITTTLNKEEDYLCEEENYLGDLVYCVDEGEIEKVSYGTDYLHGTKISENLIVYGNHSTYIYDCIANTKEIFFDNSYNISDVLIRLNSDSYFTNDIIKGVILSEEGNGSSLNNVKAQIINNGIYLVPSNLLSVFKEKETEGISIEDQVDLSHYVFSFHSKLYNLDSSSNVKAKIVYGYFDENENYQTKESRYVRIKNTHLSAWQEIKIAVDFECKISSLTSIRIMFESFNEDTSSPFTERVEIAMLSGKKGSYSSLFILENTGDSSLKYMDYNNLNRIYFTEKSSGIFTCKDFNLDYVMSLNDILLTCKSLFLGQNDDFNLYLNNLEEVINVKEAYFEYNGKKTYFKKSNLNYLFKIESAIKLKDDSYYYTDNYFKFEDDGLNKMIKEYNAIYIDMTKDEDYYIFESEKVSLVNGLVMSESSGNKQNYDYYSNRIVYTYDEYGNITKKEKYYENGLLSYVDYSYDNQDSRLREINVSEINIVESINGNAHLQESVIDLNKDFSLKNETYITKLASLNGDNNYKNILRKEYSYSPFSENIKYIKFIDIENQDNPYQCSSINYDYFGNVKDMMSKEDVKQGFEYDDEFNITKYKRDNRVIEEFSIENNKNFIVNEIIGHNDIVIYNGSRITNKKHFIYNSPVINERYYDKYGKILIDRIGSYDTIFSYESDDSIYDGSKRISSISDPFDNRIYEFEYDDVSNSVSIDKSSLEDDIRKLSIQSKGNTNKLAYTDYRYVDENNDYLIDTLEMNCSYENVLNEQKISSISYKSGNSNINILSPFYTYDNNGKEKLRSAYDSLNNDTLVYSYIREYDYCDNDVCLENIYHKFNITKRYNSDVTLEYDTCVNLAYEYDFNKNVSKELVSGDYFVSLYGSSLGNKENILSNQVEYKYDNFNQLILEKYGEDDYYTYTYDETGNILNIKYNDSIIKEFVYNSNKKLYNVIENNINKGLEYDNYGNLTRYGTNHLIYNERGKLKKYIYKKGTNTYTDTYTYNYQGQRVKRESISNNEIITRHYHNFNDKIVGEDIVIIDAYGDESIYSFDYLYDQSGVSGIRHKNKVYCFVKDLFGNIRWIMSDNVLLAEYVYDAWGNHSIRYLASDSYLEDEGYDKYVFELNPFRYRGYYYDVETQLFYCNSRYYSPELCRFISPDSIEYLDPESINGLNLYCYCYNNPISYCDPTGNSPTEWWEWLLAGVAVAGLVVGSIFTGGLLGGAFLGAAIGAGISLGTQAIQGELNWAQFALDTGVGAITGMVGVSSASKYLAAGIGTFIGGGSNFASQLISGKKIDDIDWLKVSVSAAIGGVASFFGGAGAQNSKALNSAPKVSKALNSVNKVLGRMNTGYYSSARYAQAAFTNVANRLGKAVVKQQLMMVIGSMAWYGGSTIATNILMGEW